MSLIYINLDDVIFTPSVSKFNGEEIMSLIRHLGKCLIKELLEVSTSKFMSKGILNVGVEGLWFDSYLWS